MTTDLVSYDPYDRAIDADQYPVYRRLRAEAPLYYNEQYDFFAVSRFDDVQRALVDSAVFSSARGSVLEFIKANIEMPSGVVIFEDPPLHDVHRRLLSRVFTPRRMEALESKVREFCRRALDPLVGAERFDFVADLGAVAVPRWRGSRAASGSTKCWRGFRSGRSIRGTRVARRPQLCAVGMRCRLCSGRYARRDPTRGMNAGTRRA
jgi:hypothetical protein